MHGILMDQARRLSAGRPAYVLSDVGLDWVSSAFLLYIGRQELARPKAIRR